MNGTMAEHSLEMPRRNAARVIGLRQLSATGYELSLERGNIQFKAGQLLTIHARDMLDDRSYTIASGERDECLQVLFRLIPSGKLTPFLAALKAGDTVDISGPYGEFTIREPARRMYFVATGTGIAPCRSYVRSHENLNLSVAHGVRHGEDLFYRDELAAHDYQPCVSGEATAVFHGRVTDYFRRIDIDANAHFYLCGANEMFYEMRDVLEEHGVPASSIFTEAYYYRSDT